VKEEFKGTLMCLLKWQYDIADVSCLSVPDQFDVAFFLEEGRRARHVLRPPSQ